MGGTPIDRLFPLAMVRQFNERLTQVARGFGVPFRPLVGHVPNTRATLAASEYARDHGEEALDRFRGAAMDAWWARGENIESPDVLGELARVAGLDPVELVAASADGGYLARVEATRDEAMGRAVSGIPTMFFGDRRVVGCQPFEALRAVGVGEGMTRRIRPPHPQEAP